MGSFTHFLLAFLYWEIPLGLILLVLIWERRRLGNLTCRHRRLGWPEGRTLRCLDCTAYCLLDEEASQAQNQWVWGPWRSGDPEAER